MTLYEDLKYRGLIKDEAGSDLEEKINKGGMTFYWGTDPTADSLHLGHYSSLVTAKRLMLHGHNPILLVGGATGLIGDPRPTAEREIISKELLDKNLEGIRNQVNKIFEGKAEIVNNYDWMKHYNYLEFLRDIGKYININYMINKDIISRRLETGITYAEFSYMLIQGFDFLHLYETKNCTMQVEGSDQWGNITTGLELIRKKHNKELYAFTMPLVLDKYGNKFGKSEGNALWLDKNKTSSYEMYQYLVNVDDSMVIDYLKIFTFLSKEEINDLEKSNKEKPEIREAHKKLAYEIVKDLHGIEEAEKAKKTSEEVFTKGYSLDGMIEVDIKREKLSNILDLILKASITTSKSEARRLIEQNGISINSKKVNDVNMLMKEELFNDGFLIISKGKKTHIKVNLK